MPSPLSRVSNQRGSPKAKLVCGMMSISTAGPGPSGWRCNVWVLPKASSRVMVARKRFDGGTAPGGTIDVEIADFIRLYKADEEEMRWRA